MRTLEVSEAVYQEILSRRIGREAISKTIMRELKPVEKCDIREELEQLRRQPRYDLSDLKKEYGL
ncbi:MAG: hypothetical protein II893_06965 [Methanomicrobium sp.]|nr:hypothetical protein [Methanomicrobium sp.]